MTGSPQLYLICFSTRCRGGGGGKVGDICRLVIDATINQLRLLCVPYSRASFQLLVVVTVCRA